MQPRLLVLPGVCGVLILAGALVTGLPGVASGQDSIPVVDTGVWIGIKTDTARVLNAATGETVLVIRVAGIQQGGPADQGGVLPGDILVALNGRELVSYQVYLTSVDALGPGQQAHLRLNRRGAEVETTVVVADHRPPSFPARLALPEADTAWAALWRDLESLMESLPDTLGTQLEWSASIRGSIRVESGAVSVTISDSSRTLSILRAEGSRTEAALPDSVSVSRRFRSAELAWPADTSAAEAGRSQAITADSAAAFRVIADTILLDSVGDARVELLRAQGEVALLGSVMLGGAQVRTLTGRLGHYFGVSSGVLILDVLGGSPARRAGFRPGDVIVAVGGRELATLAQLRSDLALAELPVSVTVMRHGEPVELTYPVR